MISQLPKHMFSDVKSMIRYRNVCLHKVRHVPNSMHFVLDVPSFVHKGRLMYKCMESIIREGCKSGHTFSVSNPLPHGELTDFVTTWKHNRENVKAYKVYDFADDGFKNTQHQVSTDIHQDIPYVGIHLRLTSTNPIVMSTFIDTCRLTIRNMQDGLKDIHVIIETPSHGFYEIISHNLIDHIPPEPKFHIKIIDSAPSDLGCQTWLWMGSP